MKKSFYTFTLVVITVLLVCIAIFTKDQSKMDDTFSPEEITELFSEPPTRKPTPTPKPTSVRRPTSTPKPTQKIIKTNVDFGQNGQTFLDYEDGELVGKVRIDDIRVETEDYGYMERLQIYFIGEILECTEDIYIKYKLFDTEDYVIDDDYLRIDGLCTGDKFKNKYIIYDTDKLEDYKIKLFDNPE